MGFLLFFVVFVKIENRLIRSLSSQERGAMARSLPWRSFHWLERERERETDGRTNQAAADPRSSLFEFFIVNARFGKNEPFPGLRRLLPPNLVVSFVE
jgi:hypothetical protein